MIQKTNELFVLLPTLGIREYQIKLNKTELNLIHVSDGHFLSNNNPQHSAIFGATRRNTEKGTRHCQTTFGNVIQHRKEQWIYGLVEATKTKNIITCVISWWYCENRESILLFVLK